MKIARWTVFAGVVVAGAIVLALAGCDAGGDLLAYTGGGLPPGEPDLGGVVVASIDGDTATAQTPIEEPPTEAERLEGAQVVLMRGRAVVGRTQTGDGGYFRFQHPDTGRYTLVVTPPASRPELRGSERTVTHVRGQRTFVTVELQRGTATATATAGIGNGQ